MANTFLLKIITPCHDVYNGEVEKINLKSVDGEFQILAHHQNMLASTVPSIATFKDANGNDEELFISKSIVQINNNEVTISSDAAEFEEDIDEVRAQEAMERAQNRLKEVGVYNKQRAETALLRAKERLKLKKSSNKI